MTTYRSARLAASGALALLGACSHGPRAGPAVAPVARPVPAGEVDTVLALLDQGNAADARKRIGAGLKRDPMNPSLQVLRDSLDRDPKDLLGPDSYPYTVRPGETMSDLAARFLGNRLKSYQLARYNGIDRPVALAPGQVLRIPGTPPRSEPVRRAEPKPAAPTPPRAAPAPAKPAPRPAARAANPAAARQARAAGLAALNQGNVARAVGLLQRAASLDPANPAIARDLARARRIAATVRARR